MTPEIAMKKAVQAMRILNEIWHPDLPVSSRRHLANCIGQVKDLADIFGSQKMAGWHYGDSDDRFAEQIWSMTTHEDEFNPPSKGPQQCDQSQQS